MHDLFSEGTDHELNSASLHARRKFRSNPVELTPLAVVPRPRALSTVLTESTNEQDVSLYHIEVISPHHIALVVLTHII